MDFNDLVKRSRRLLDANYSPRKMMLVVLFMLVFILYAGPYILRMLFSSSPSLVTESAAESIASRVAQFKSALSSLDAHLLYTQPPDLLQAALHQHVQEDGEDSAALPSQKFVPFIGNGYIGAWLTDTQPLSGGSSGGSEGGGELYIRHGRNLAHSLPYEPLLHVHVDGGTLHEAVVTHYTQATVHRIQAWRVDSFVTHQGLASADGPPPPVPATGAEGGGNIEVTHTLLAHRTIPSLLLQDVVVMNPNPVSVFVRVSRTGEKRWSRVVTDTFTVESPSVIDKKGQQTRLSHKYTVVTGTVDAPVQATHRHVQASSKVVVVAVATLQLPPLLQVEPRMSTTLHVLTAFNYSDPVPLSGVHEATQAARQAVMQTLRSAVKDSSVASLVRSHSESWAALWRAGVHMVTSRAHDSLNGDIINATLYNVLSQVRAPLQEPSVLPQRWAELAQELGPLRSDGCYQGHHTLQAEKLWSPLSSVEHVQRLVQAWLITLEKQGCQGLLRAGADGVLQAMLLSMGGLSFRNLHLQMNTQASDLHRDLTFRRLNYGAGVHLNLSVEVQDHDYKPVLWLALEQQQTPYDVSNDSRNVKLNDQRALVDRVFADFQKSGQSMEQLTHGLFSREGSQHVNINYIRMQSYGYNGLDLLPADSEKNLKEKIRAGLHDSFYACDGGCLDPPVQLGHIPLMFPVKLTEPVTAVLYVTADKQHMQELKLSIHVKEVAIAPGHHQSVIALHRHGHKWGRLPPLFWLSIAALIVTFHLFLVKLVINEYCSGDGRARYRKLSDF